MNRRSFLAASVGTGVLANMAHEELTAAESGKLAATGLTKANVPTPALMLDLDVFEANVRKLAEHCRQTGRALRPHSKTHKCPEIARRQVAAGAVGVCAATVPEVEAMVAGGVNDVLLTSPIVDPGKVMRIAALVQRGAKVMLSVGHPRQVELLAEAAGSHEVNFDLLVDTDVGDRRTGSLPGAPALELAKLIGGHKRLRVRGVQAYAGLASHVVGFEARAKTSQEVMAKAVDTRELLAKAGFDAGILSGGSTGTYNIDSAIDGVTELQCGSYIFMDMDYRRIGGRDGNAVYADFQPALTVLATVVSAAHADRVTIDAGTKALDTTTASRAEAKSWPGLTYAKGGDEFGVVSLEAGATTPRLGERIEFIVPHCDPTTNLYDRFYVVQGEKVVDVWPITARRETTGGKFPSG